jgi:hypothetical protein
MQTLGPLHHRTVVKRPGRDADQLSLSSAEVKNDGFILALPIHFHGVLLN